MVEGLAELLGRKDLVLQAAARSLLDRRPPVLQRLLQGMGGRHPVRELELVRLVLGLGLKGSVKGRPGERNKKSSQRALAHVSPPLFVPPRTPMVSAFLFCCRRAVGGHSAPGAGGCKGE